MKRGFGRLAATATAVVRALGGETLGSGGQVVGVGVVRSRNHGRGLLDVARGFDKFV